MTDSTPDVASGVRRWQRLWPALALAGMIAAWLLSPADHEIAWWLPWALVGLTALGEGTELVLRYRQSSETITLLEVAVVVDLLLLPPALVAPVIVAGVAIVHVLRRRDWEKVAFNVSMHAAGAAAAALVMVPFSPPDDIITPERAAASLVGIAVFGLVNVIALGGLLARFEGEHPIRTMRGRGRFIVADVFGNGVVGVLGVALATAYPWLVPLLLTPVAALHLTYRGVARTETLLSEVRAERDLLDRVLAGASDGIALLDSAGRVQLWNPAMARITGCPVGQAIGRNIEDVVRTTDADGVDIDPSAPLATLRPGDSPAWMTDVFVKRHDGNKMPVRTTHTVLFDDRGAPTGDVVLMHDLSREREVQSMKEDFVARVSHELRTPLTPIRGYAQILVSRGDRLNDTEKKDALNRIVERVTHLTRLVDDLLLAARVSSNDPRAIGEVRPVEIDVVPTVKELVGWFQRDHAEREFPLEVEEGIPQVYADPLRTNQILANLMSNACKYSPPDTPVELSVTRQDGYVAIAVRDRGPGIPEAELERVFERFHRLEPPDRMRTGGIGLGLYIARRLTEAMDGRIELQSTVGQGSTFRLLVPVASVGDRARIRPRLRAPSPSR